MDSFAFTACNRLCEIPHSGEPRSRSTGPMMFGFRISKLLGGTTLRMAHCYRSFGSRPKPLRSPSRRRRRPCLGANGHSRVHERSACLGARPKVAKFFASAPDLPSIAALARHATTPKAKAACEGDVVFEAMRMYTYMYTYM